MTAHNCFSNSPHKNVHSQEILNFVVIWGVPCWVGCDIVIILRDKTILISYRRAAVAAETDDRDNDAAVQDGVNVLADAGQIIFNNEIILSDEIFL